MQEESILLSSYFTEALQVKFYKYTVTNNRFSGAYDKETLNCFLRIFSCLCPSFFQYSKILYVWRALKRIRFGKTSSYEVHHSLGGKRLGVLKGMEMDMAEAIRLQLHLTM